MERILIGGGIAFLTVCSTAAAADFPMPAEPYVAPMAAEEPLNWTGIYVGVHGGFGGDRFEYPFHYTLPAPQGGPGLDVTGSADLTSSGWFAGGQAGFNWQMAPRWLVGIEGDIAWSDIKGELGANATLSGFVAGSGSAKAGTEIEWFGTGRGRVGFLPLEDFLVYGTGGVAFGKTNSYYNFSSTIGSISGSIDDTLVGWTAGGGVEYALTKHLSFKTEYLYVDLGKSTLYDGPLFGIGDNLKIESDNHFHTIKGGLNYRF